MKGSLGGVPLPFPINPLPDISEENRLSSGKTAHANNDIMESSQDNNEDDMNNNDDLSEDELVIEEPEINSKESLKGVILKENVSPSSSQDVISASDLTGKSTLTTVFRSKWNKDVIQSYIFCCSLSTEKLTNLVCIQYSNAVLHLEKSNKLSK